MLEQLEDYYLEDIQMLIKPPTLLILTLFLLLNLFVPSVNASTYSGSVYVPISSGTEVVNLHLTHNGVNVTVPRDFTVDTTVDLDTTNSTLTFTKYSLGSNAFKFSYVDQFTVDFGQTIDITTTLRFDSFSGILLSDVGPLTLTPTLGGIFDIEGISDTVPDRVLFLNGTYDIQGPTESVSGEFSIQQDGVTPFLGYDLDTNGFPETVDLLAPTGVFPGVGQFQNALSGLIYEGVIDGQDYQAALGVTEFRSGTNIALSAVPVPAAAWLFASGLLGLIGIARRKAA